MPLQTSRNLSLGVNTDGNFSHKVLILDALQSGEKAEPKPHVGVEVPTSPDKVYSGFQIPSPPQECSFVTLSP